MKPGKKFAAPWALSVKLLTLFSIAIIGGVAALGLSMTPVDTWVWRLSMVGLPLGILVGTALYMVLGYELTDEAVFVRRLGWKSRLSLANLVSADADPEAMKGSWRVFGNGGLFCLAGRFRNKKLGAYRALATDPKLSVVLRFADKVVVVTPDNPRKFIAQIKKSG